MGKRKLPEFAVVLDLYNRGFSSYQIGEMYGSTGSTVLQMLCRNGVPRRPRNYPGYRSKESYAAHSLAIRGEKNGRYKDGSRSTFYRKLIDISKCTTCGGTDRIAVHHKDHDHYNNEVENLVALCRTCHGRQHGSGEANPQAKLTSAIVAEIRALAGTMTHKMIGAKFDVSSAHVCDIISGRRWASTMSETNNGV